MEGVKNPKLALIVGTCLVVLGLFIAAYVLTIEGFEDQRDDGKKTLLLGDKKGRSGIDISARVTNVEPAADDMVLRLEFAPTGSYRNRGTVVLAREVNVLISTSKGKSLLTFPRGQIMSPAEATVSLRTGDLLDYPFDKYRAEFGVLAEDGGGRPVPIAEGVSAGFNGFKVETATGRGGPPGARIVNFKLRRATSTIFYAVFIMAVFWLVSLSALGLAVSLAIKRRPWEGTFTGFLAALLFAFPAVRNAMPGDPPIGSFVDYLAFFWAMGIAALALLVAVNAWIFRRLRK